ncbi:hypothetical protein TNIN_123411 [Trichonephila inaurata madagascariensis]|uniref:Uncharacterized protein n=1 Tax=Trichonephila inaurata madagascariensis TaxID=2747483 RepID=A0A8X6K0I9_9ARAC|nr:hypothetical protein TNIN_123411 [Trichonephila inaurata madagascariensis]
MSVVDDLRWLQLLKVSLKVLQTLEGPCQVFYAKDPLYSLNKTFVKSTPPRRTFNYELPVDTFICNKILKYSLSFKSFLRLLNRFMSTRASLCWVTATCTLERCSNSSEQRSESKISL